MIRLRQLLASALLSLMLVGCAGERLHEEGLELIEQGQVTEGLAKLEAAVKEEPQTLTFRSDLIRKRTQAVQRLLISAGSERIAGHLDAAALLYQRVLQIDRDDPRAKAGLEHIEMDRRHATALAQAKGLVDKHDLEGAQQVLRTILLEDPNQVDAKLLQRKVDEQLAKDAMTGPTLRAEFKKPVTLQFRDANLRMVIEALSRSNGINILLDKDVKNDLKTTIFVKDAPLEDTIDLILLQNQLEKKILSDNTIFIYPSNPAKIKEYQDLMIRSFQLTNADAKQMQTMVKTLLKTKDLYVDEKTNSLVMRDTPDAVRLAEKLIAAQDLAEPEVMLEVEVLEITRARLRELGVKLPEQIALSAPGIPATTTVNNLPGGGVVTTTTPAQPLTLESLRHLNGSDINVSTLNASIDLRREVGDANILASPRIRVRNREKAKILIGDRVPVITNAVTPVSTGAPVVTGTVQYLDVGLKLDVEPDIHLDDDVAIKMSLEVSSIVREVASGPTLAYQIGTRTTSTVLRLQDGETQILAGLISDEDRKSAQQFPGLGELPIVGRLFSSHKDDAKKTEIVLSITPHLTRGQQRPDAKNVEFWSGTDSTLRSRPIVLQPGSAESADKPAAALPTPAATPSAPASSSPVAPTPAAAPVPAALLPAPHNSTSATTPVRVTTPPQAVATAAAQSARTTTPIATASAPMPSTPPTVLALAAPQSALGSSAPAIAPASTATPPQTAATAAPLPARTATPIATVSGSVPLTPATAPTAPRPTSGASTLAPAPATTPRQPAAAAAPPARITKPIATTPSGPPVVLSTQGPTQAKVGDEFQVLIEAQTSQSLGTLSFTLGYDQKALNVVRVAEGDLMKQNGKKTIFTSKVDPNTGHTFLHMVRLDPKGVTGKGSVATVTFAARSAAAKSPIVITGPATLSSNGQELPRSVSAPLIVTLAP